MPTIEIASINASGLKLKQSDFDVAIIEENQLESHRGLFYDILRQQDGVILHIGNPDFKDDKEGGFFAGELVDWDFEPGQIVIGEVDSDNPIAGNSVNQQFKFKLLNKYRADIDKLLQIALDSSPIKKVCFLSDYQFGPDEPIVEIIYTIREFWVQHDNDGLRLNTMYEMYGR